MSACRGIGVREIWDLSGFHSRIEQKMTKKPAETLFAAKSAETLTAISAAP
ncbi:hypothetical protein [Spectribacter hydrogenoxidans]|uniref:Uncharacterized protein n=1 Tax=Spectribacter hydrogenoxidans TaxID=3075608 RepID=A0ABU3C3M4_9GAMM|nr:hypothetical protein [Salinisphaera sp. W335]MDT0635944.1 hypothetical protein [Salinisphaera sp. W335]